MNTIFVIKAFSVTHGDRVIGWYDNYEDAKTALVLNSDIIAEMELNCPWFEYALIEEVPMGVYPGNDDNKVQFFKWELDGDTNGKYVECDRPERYNGIVAFTMG